MNLHCILTVFILIIAVSYGCGGGGGASGGVGFIPKITSSISLNINDLNNPIQTKVFIEGDQIGFGVMAEDTDKNMETLWVTEYLSNSQSPFDGPTSFKLPEQSSESITYYPIGSITISGEKGNRRFDLQIEDERGNLTNVSIVNIMVQ